jgi:hypothetical protein
LDLVRENLLLLSKLLVILQPLQVAIVGESGRWLVGDLKTFLDCGSRVDALPPRLQVGEPVEIDAREPEHVNPAKARDIGNAVFVAHKIICVLELGVEDTNKALGLASVSLHAVCDALLRKSVEVVGLSLHWAEAAMLPRHPLFCAGDVEGVGEAELVIRVIVTREVCQDSYIDQSASVVTNCELFAGHIASSFTSKELVVNQG